MSLTYTMKNFYGVILMIKYSTTNNLLKIINFSLVLKRRQILLCIIAIILLSY